MLLGLALALCFIGSFDHYPVSLYQGQALLFIFLALFTFRNLKLA
jgi:hypothetical protein